MSTTSDLWAEYVTACITSVDAWSTFYVHVLGSSPCAPELSGPLSTFMGDMSDLYLDWAKGLVPPIPPPNTKVDPKQKPATTTVAVTAPANVALRLRPTAFVDGAVHAVPDSLVTLTPAVVGAGKTVTVTVSVLAPIGAPAGTYGGAIVDDAASIVVDRVEVAIVPV